MVGPTKETASSSVPVFNKVFETATGGFILDDAGVTTGSTVKAGTVIGFDEATRKAKVAKMATMQAAATNTATAYQVLKGHNLKVNDTINAAGGTARAITTIVTTDPGFDTINVGTTIGVAVAAGDALYVDDYGYSSPKGLLYFDIEAGTNTELAVVLRGTAYENRINSVPAVVKNKLPNIIFSKSF